MTKGSYDRTKKRKIYRENHDSIFKKIETIVKKKLKKEEEKNI